MAKVAINGFGRVGRLFFRQAFGHKDLDIVAVNDLGSVENLAYLLKYDTVYRTYGKSVKVKGDVLIVDGKEIKFLQVKNPAELPWKDLKVDVVVEATGVFAEYSKAKAHVDAGAKRVVITAPAKDADKEGATVLMGVNEGEMKKTSLTSNGSCTTNAASPVIRVMSENPGIKKAILNTVHGYTATQSLVDGPVKGDKFRRGRAAAENIIPSTTGAAVAVTQAIPEFKGKFDGIAMRVPILVGSVADITFISARDTSVKEINDIFRNAAKESHWKDILTVTEDPIVSSDIIGEPYAAIVDLSFTKVVDGNLVKVLSWYDNEFGYVTTLLKHVLCAVKLL